MGDFLSCLSKNISRVYAKPRKSIESEPISINIWPT
jgi:hypothetical protein